MKRAAKALGRFMGRGWETDYARDTRARVASEQVDTLYRMLREANVRAANFEARIAELEEFVLQVQRGTTEYNLEREATRLLAKSV